MNLRFLLARIGLSSLFCCAFASSQQPDDDGFVSLFTGKNLSGWHNVNGASDTWSVRDEKIICSGKPICLLRTVKQYQNFVLELDWLHLQPKGNSGCFVWSDAITARGQPFSKAIECQILDGQETENYTSHGDVFAIHGAVMTPDRPHPAGWMRCLPSERRSKPAGQWNHYRISCVDGTVKLEVNGKEVAGGSEVNPRKGYICLESEGSEVHFRRLRIKELPPAKEPLKPEQVAATDVGFERLYSGVDLSGWRVAALDAAHWKVKDWKLECDGLGGPILSEREVGDAVVVVDWRWTSKPSSSAFPFDLRGALVASKLEAHVKEGEWSRCEIALRQDKATIVLNGKTLAENVPLPGLPAQGSIVLGGKATGPVQFANIYVRP